MSLRSLYAALIVFSLASPVCATNPMVPHNKPQQSAEADQQTSVDESELSHRGPIYGIQMMTYEEQHLYRANLSALETREDQEQFLREHHRLMDERALAQGITLRSVLSKRHTNKRPLDLNKNPKQVNTTHSW